MLTVAEVLNKNNLELKDVSVIDHEWGCGMKNYGFPDCGCLNAEVISVQFRKRTILYTGEPIFNRKEEDNMTLYKVYWEFVSGECKGYKGYTYIEVPDSFGRRKAAEARRRFQETYSTENKIITKVVKEA